MYLEKALPKQLALLLVCFLTLQGCKKREDVCTQSLYACFSLDSLVTEMNAGVSFHNCSRSANGGYVWDFGDGSTSNETNPTHRYAKEGTFTVTLTAKSACEDVVDVAQTTVKVAQRAFLRAKVLNLPLQVPFRGDWDAGSEPDVKLHIVGNSTNYFQTAVNQDQQLIFPFDLVNVNDTFILPTARTLVEVLDMDANLYQVMARFYMTTADYIPDGERKIILTDEAGSAICIEYYLL